MSPVAPPRKDPLPRAIDLAIAGDTRPLWDLLSRGSGLPGPKINQQLADAFAEECRTRKGAADKLALSLAMLDADEAQGASPMEILPVAGVLAIAARASAGEKERERALSLLHEKADDLRFRVRDAVVLSMVRIGGADGDRLLCEVEPWMDGYFHAAAILLALSNADWLNHVSDVDVVVQTLDQAFALASGANRATARYPGWKALLDALIVAPPAAAARFGVPIFDMIARWAGSKDPVLRDAVDKILNSKKLTSGRLATEVARVRKALVTATPLPRDPRSLSGPTRQRGGGRRR